MSRAGVLYSQTAPQAGVPTASTDSLGGGVITVTLQDALAQARKYGNQVQSAQTTVALAREDTKQAKAAALPSLNALNQFIYTEGNRTPSGVFIANDGVHVYNEQALVHEELLSLLRRGEIRRAAAAEATARAKVEVAVRGLSVTVIQDYYAIASAERRVKNAQTTLDEARRFSDITQKLERGGEVAHSDAIKAQITTVQRQRDLEDAMLAVEKAKIALAVLIFRDVQQSFEIADDLDQPLLLPIQTAASAAANFNSPDLRVAQSSLNEAKLGMGVAHSAYLPSLSLDFAYGIDANQFAITSTNAQATGRSTLPNYEVARRRNLGYSAQVTLNVPIWNWGATYSKVKQASFREKQAELELTFAQRQLKGEFAAFYKEAQTAGGQVQSLRSSSELSGESLRLVLLRYQAGEATVLEVVDAETTASQARGAYDDGLLRYRVALANLQTLTGNF